MSNTGVVILCSVDHEHSEYSNQLLILDLNGSKLFEKTSSCPISATTINNDGTIAAVAFAGSEECLECYQIYIIDVTNSKVVQINPTPDRTSVTDMEFDENNSLKVHGVT